MSRAVVFSEYGDPGVLGVVEVEPGIPGPGEVRVRIRAAGCQPADCLLRSGRMARWTPASFPQRLGNEFAGVVEERGEGVDGLGTGTEVIGWTAPAAYADHVVVPADQVIVKPPSMPWEQAGALSASGQTAATALRLLGVGAGETLLIHAAAGGVGTFAVQIARAKGATVVGTASPRNHDYLRSLGAVPVAYGPGLVERLRAAAPGGIDVAFDASGSEEALRASLELLADRARLATVAFGPAAGELGVPRLSTERSQPQLTELAALYEAGELRIEIQRPYPLDEAPEAHRVIEGGHVRGKVVLHM